LAWATSALLPLPAWPRKATTYSESWQVMRVFSQDTILNIYPATCGQAVHSEAPGCPRSSGPGMLTPGTKAPRRCKRDHRTRHAPPQKDRQPSTKHGATPRYKRTAPSDSNQLSHDRGASDTPERSHWRRELRQCRFIGSSIVIKRTGYRTCEPQVIPVSAGWCHSIHMNTDTSAEVGILAGGSASGTSFHVGRVQEMG
jgi:hypothetical protein